MKFFFFGKLLEFLGRKLDGYKTKIAGAGWLLLGIVITLGQMFPDTGLADNKGIESALACFNAAMTAWGLGGKAEKIKSAMEVKADAAAAPETFEQNLGN